MALAEDGVLYSWGLNKHGELGRDCPTGAVPVPGAVDLTVRLLLREHERLPTLACTRLLKANWTHPRLLLRGNLIVPWLSVLYTSLWLSWSEGLSASHGRWQTLHMGQR